VRYYKIVISNSSGAAVKTWTSHPNGNQAPPDPGALMIELDAFNAWQGTPLPGSYVRIWGISLDDINQARNLNGMDVSVYGGMGKGLPLANPAEAGLLIQGHIQQAFANWVGTTMTLDIIMVAGTITAGTAAPQNIHFDWPAGQQMAQAIRNTLSILLPKATLNINIDPKLVLPNTETHFAATIGQLAEYFTEISRKVINTGPALAGQFNTPNNALSTYPGVQVHIDGPTVTVADGTTQATPKAISIFDLIGQPTWIGFNIIQVTCVMRGDVKVGDFITLPKTRATITPASYSAYSQERQDIIFQGTFYVMKVHHVGNYKSPDALAWVTVFDAITQTQTTDGQASIPTASAPENPLVPSGPRDVSVSIGDLTVQ